MDLITYIEMYYSGNQSEFARACGKTRQHVSKWISNGYVVLNGKLHSGPRFELPETEKPVS